MIDNQSERGAQWRIWDLQVHTPYSILNNQFGPDFRTYAATLFRRAYDNHVSVIGITDYFCIEGYKALRQLLADPSPLVSECSQEVIDYARSLTYLPNVEFRLSVFVNQNRVNYHVLLSDELTIEDIEQNFLSQIKFDSIGRVGASTERLALTIRNIESIGERLKREHKPFQSKANLQVGMENIFVDVADVMEPLEQQSRKFSGKYLTALPADEDLSNINWDSQGHLARKNLVQNAGVLFSGSPKTRIWSLGKLDIAPENFASEFGSLKLTVVTSDCHSQNEIFSRSDNLKSWIKAEPSFIGLRQAVIEPERRSKNQEQNPYFEELSERQGNTVDRVHAHKIPGSALPEEWFNFDLPLNPGLVAIIGTKGSGKSALLDIIALLGNSHREHAFPFLSDSRFRGHRNNRAQAFMGTLTWFSGGETQKQLSEHIDPLAPEHVKYLPQNHIERLCSEISDSEGERFSEELEHVVFDHLPESQKLSASSLSELLALKVGYIEQQAQVERSKLTRCNEKIVQLEEKSRPEYREGIEKKRSERLKDVQGLLKIKPQKVKKPQETKTREQAELEYKLSRARQRYKVLYRRRERLRDEVGILEGHLNSVTRLEGGLRNLAGAIEEHFASYSDDLDRLGLDAQGLVKIQIQWDALKTKRERFQFQLERKLRWLSEGDGSLDHSIEVIENKGKELREKLEGKSKAYESYIMELEEWRGRLRGIVGEKNQPDSLKGLSSALRNLDNVPGELQARREQRHVTVQRLVAAIRRIVEISEELYAPVQEFVDEKTRSRSAVPLDFTSKITEKGFRDQFLRMINQARKGSFAGVIEGAERVDRLVSAYLRGGDPDINGFLREIEHALHYDVRDSSTSGVSVGAQLRTGVSTTELYDHVFGLKYLVPQYEIQWDGKRVSELSPGERGMLLLVFYLLIDKSRKPLLIDQPEENLDNETVYRVLVDAIRDAATRRQVMIVTHNPNLAVVCDADQVICAKIDKLGGNKIEYLSGSIEMPAMTQRIIDVLEGTRPAFDNRRTKYGLLGNGIT